jgi:predicted aspartyl protease
MRSQVLVALVVVSLLASRPADAANSCRLVRVTSVDLGTDESGGVYVPMTIAGQNVNLLIDTGGILSMLTESEIKVLGLPKQILPPETRMSMFGGTKIDHFTWAYGVVLGGLKSNQLHFLIMPDGDLPSQMGGTLAPDIMSAYDVEFDFANAKFGLFRQDHCPGEVVYWTRSDSVRIPFEVDRMGHINFPVQVDGQKIPATLDTGSSRSIASFEEVKSDFKIDEKTPDMKLVSDAGEKRHTYHYPFKTLTFGGVTVNNPDLLLVPNDDSRMMGWTGDPKMIIGMGILRQLHLYVAYGERALYVPPASAH